MAAHHCDDDNQCLEHLPAVHCLADDTKCCHASYDTCPKPKKHHCDATDDGDHRHRPHTRRKHTRRLISNDDNGVVAVLVAIVVLMGLAAAYWYLRRNAAAASRSPADDIINERGDDTVFTPEYQKKQSPVLPATVL